MVLGPVAYWVVISHLKDHDAEKALDQMAVILFLLGGILLLLDGLFN